MMQSSDIVYGSLFMRAQKIVKDAQVLFFTPPMIPGYSASSGIELNMQDKTGGDLEKFFELLETKDLGARRHWNRYLEYLSIGIHNIRMLYDTKIVIGGYVGAYIEKYMEDLCAR